MLQKKLTIKRWKIPIREKQHKALTNIKDAYKMLMKLTLVAYPKKLYFFVSKEFFCFSMVSLRVCYK